MQVFRVIDGSLLIKLPFRRPILDWQNVPAKFFEMIYDALSGTTSVAASHFSLNTENNLGSVNVKYSIGGGQSSIKLSSEVLDFEFLQVTPESEESLNKLLLQLHEALPDSFPHLFYEIVDARVLLHAELVGEVQANEFLNRFHVKGVDHAFAEFGSYQPECAAHFDVRASDSTWLCRVFVEKSNKVPNGIFIDVQTIVKVTDNLKTFVEKSQKIQALRAACFSAAGLQLETAV